MEFPLLSRAIDHTRRGGTGGLQLGIRRLDGGWERLSVVDANATASGPRAIPYELGGDTPALRQVVLSPDGGVLVVAFQEDLLRGGQAEAFDVASSESITILPVEGAVQRVALSTDGSLLAVGKTKRSGLKS